MVYTKESESQKKVGEKQMHVNREHFAKTKCLIEPSCGSEGNDVEAWIGVVDFMRADLPEEVNASPMGYLKDVEE